MGAFAYHGQEDSGEGKYGGGSLQKSEGAYCRCSNGVVACCFGGTSMMGWRVERERMVCICGGDYLGRMDVC